MLGRIALLVLLAGSPAYAAGTIPVALTQQSDANGKPLSGALLYTYFAGTVNAPQNTFQDFGLTLTNPWPLQADTTSAGVPMFYLADVQGCMSTTDPGARRGGVRLSDHAGDRAELGRRQWWRAPASIRPRLHQPATSSSEPPAKP